MTATRLMISVANAHRRIGVRLHESSILLPTLLRKPQVILQWLLRAHHAQLSLLAILLFLAFAFPPVRDATLNRLYSRESFGEKVSGVFGAKSRADKRRASISRAVTLFVWLGSCGTVVVLFWLRIPATIQRASAIARERECTADALADSQPPESVALYRAALAVACDRGHEATLAEKIRKIAGITAAQAGDGDKAAGPAGPGKLPSNPEPPFASQRGQSPARGDLVANRYSIVGQLGRGASGIVHQADDVVLDRPVALKELRVWGADDDTMGRFHREARILARLNHPNIVQVYDLVEYAGNVWIAMELVEGGDLAAELKREHHLPIEDTARLGESMANALAFAHERGIVHRDLKPLNVLLEDGHTPKITDFGLAKFSENSAHTVEGTILGSPYYMSPEQADGQSADFRSDIYSLGIMLYHMLVGRVPFEGEIPSVLMQHIRRTPPPLAKVAPQLEVPKELERLVRQMLAKDPRRRPRDMSAVAKHLRPLSGSPQLPRA